MSTDRQTDRVKPIYPHTHTPVCGGYIIVIPKSRAIRIDVFLQDWILDYCWSLFVQGKASLENMVYFLMHQFTSMVLSYRGLPVCQETTVQSVQQRNSIHDFIYLIQLVLIDVNIQITCAIISYSEYKLFLDMLKNDAIRHRIKSITYLL